MTRSPEFRTGYKAAAAAELQSMLALAISQEEFESRFQELHCRILDGLPPCDDDLREHSKIYLVQAMFRLVNPSGRRSRDPRRTQEEPPAVKAQLLEYVARVRSTACAGHWSLDAGVLHDEATALMQLSRAAEARDRYRLIQQWLDNDRQFSELSPAEYVDACQWSAYAYGTLFGEEETFRLQTGGYRLTSQVSYSYLLELRKSGQILHHVTENTKRVLDPGYPALEVPLWLRAQVSAVVARNSCFVAFAIAVDAIQQEIRLLGPKRVTWTAEMLAAAIRRLLQWNSSQPGPSPEDGRHVEPSEVMRELAAHLLRRHLNEGEETPLPPIEEFWLTIEEAFTGGQIARTDMGYFAQLYARCTGPRTDGPTIGDPGA